jgi:coatomer protein complex subunit epsilon
MADELFALKTNFYIGAHQAVISEALTVSPSTDAVRIERDFFMYRAYVEQAQYHLVKDEVGADAPASLQAVKLLATYLSSPRDAKETCLLQLKEWLADANAANNWHLQVIAATVYCAEADYKSALGAIHQSSQLDCMALVAHIYLAMQRPDLAKKQLGLLQEADDDATLTKLVAAWVALSEGSDKAQDALYEFQELGDRYSRTLLLLNGLAACHLQMGKFDEAERVLQEAMSKSATDPNTLANMAATMHHLRKDAAAVNRAISQLRVAASDHPWLAKHAALEADFDRCATQFGTA